MIFARQGRFKKHSPKKQCLSLATVMLNRGLELVERLSDESTGHAQSAAAKSALVRLLDSNLSAKYWVTGRLEPSDLIKDVEFFDAGPVSHCKV